MLSLRAGAGRLIIRLALGIVLLTGSWHIAAAGDPRLHPSQGSRPLPGYGQPGLGRPLYAPPPFIDYGPPMSERPFARPFIDFGSPMSERPLAPIGGGGLVAPGSMP